MTGNRPALLGDLLATLLREGSFLERLAGLAQTQRQSLINSQFEALESINEEMLGAANEFVPLEAERAALLEQLGISTLSEAATLADDLGVTGFGDAHERLRVVAAEFRSAQEQNAALVLQAIRLRDRWMNFLGGRMTPTYGSGGHSAEVSQQRQIVSKSA